MGQKGNWARRMVDGAQLYGEPVPGQTIIEIAGDRRVLVERHEGVVEYGNQKIRVKAKYGIICITGCQLQLKQMSREQLIVTGQIESVQIQRRCC